MLDRQNLKHASLEPICKQLFSNTLYMIQYIVLIFSKLQNMASLILSLPNIFSYKLMVFYIKNKAILHTSLFLCLARWNIFVLLKFPLVEDVSWGKNHVYVWGKYSLNIPWEYSVGKLQKERTKRVVIIMTNIHTRTFNFISCSFNNLYYKSLLDSIHMNNSTSEYQAT